jgi:hypothetical protein
MRSVACLYASPPGRELLREERHQDGARLRRDDVFATTAAPGRRLLVVDPVGKPQFRPVLELVFGVRPSKEWGSVGPSAVDKRRSSIRSPEC